MNKIILSGGKYYIKLAYNPEWIKQIKTFKAMWNPQGKVWELPARGLDYTDFIKFLKNAGIEFSHISYLVRINNAFYMPWLKKQVEILGMGNNVYKIKDYQWKGIQFIILHSGTLMADEMGLGKSLQSLAAALYLQAFPLLIICPASLKLNWLNECLKWLPVTPQGVFVAGTKQEFNLKYSIYIINYEQVEKYLLKGTYQTPKFKFCIIDESHYVKNNKANRTKAVKKVVEEIPHVVCNTGTPITNTPYDLYSQLLILNTFRQHFGKKVDFVYRYCGGVNRWGAPLNVGTNLDELNVKLNNFMIRRYKKDVLKELPNTRDIIIPIEISDYNKYLKMEKECIEELIKKYPNADILVNLLKKNPVNVLSEFTKLRRCIGQLKFTVIKDWLDNWLISNPGKKIVVYTHFVDLAELLHSNYKEQSVLFTGRLNLKAKEEVLKKFKTIREVRIIFCTIQSIKTGINLTEASTTLFCELPWTPADMEQAKARIHRIGQEDICENYILLASNTLEEYIWKGIILKKTSVISGAVDGLEVMVKDLMRKYSVGNYICV